MWTENILKTKLSEKRWRDSDVISQPRSQGPLQLGPSRRWGRVGEDHGNEVGDLLGQVFVQHKSKMTDDCCVFKFLRRSVDGKHLIGFQSETYVFRFLRHSVDRALIALKKENFGLFLRWARWSWTLFARRTSRWNRDTWDSRRSKSRASVRHC